MDTKLQGFICMYIYSQCSRILGNALFGVVLIHGVCSVSKEILLHNVIL